MTDITKSCRDINELSAVAKKACALFLDECKKANIGIFITETYRSQARQNYLYEQGRTRPGQKVTWTKSSNHTGRMAWDIAVNPPKNLYDVATLKQAGAIAKKLNIEWGGTWSKANLDMPHFQVDKNWKAPTVKTTSTNTEVKKETNPSSIKSIGKIKVTGVTTAAIIMDSPDRTKAKNIGTIKKNSTIDIAGSVAGKNNSQGYWEIIFNGKRAYVSAQYGKLV